MSIGFFKRPHCPSCLTGQSNKLIEIKYSDPTIKIYLFDFYSPQGNYSDKNITNAVYSVLQCVKCKLIYQEYTPDDGLMQEIYTSWISPRGQEIPESLESIIAQRFELFYELNLLAKLLKPRNNEIKVLDFGLGWSEWAIIARRFGFKVFGTEINQKQVAFAKKHGIVILSDKELIKHSFGFINTEQVFEHVESPNQLIKLLRSCLAPNGLIKISIPNGQNISKLLQNNPSKLNFLRLNPIAPLEHINCFNVESLDHLALSTRLEVYDIPLILKLESIIDTSRITGGMLNLHLAKGFLYHIYRQVFNRGIYRIYKQTD